MGTLKRPALSVELWIGNSDGWTLNGGTLSRLTAGNLLEGYTDQWVDLRCETITATWRRGSVTPTDFYVVNPGHASVKIYDPDRELDPSNTLGPYYAKLRAGIPFRLSWTNRTEPVSSLKQALFTGYLWSLKWDDDYATVTAVDELTKLAQVDLTATTSQGSGDTGIQRIQRILNQANSTATLQSRSAITGRPMAATTLAGNALSLVKTAAASEWGILTVRPDGILSYGAEWWTIARDSELAGLNSLPEVFTQATVPGLEYGSIRNVIYATSTAGALTPVTTTNQASIDANGLNRWTFDTILRDQADLSWWAGIALNLYKANPPGYPQTVGVNGSYDDGTHGNTDVYATLNPPASDLIGVAWTISIANLSASVQVCGRTDNYTPEKGWETTFTTFANPYTYSTNYFTLDSDPKDRLDYSAVLK